MPEEGMFESMKRVTWLADISVIMFYACARTLWSQEIPVRDVKVEKTADTSVRISRATEARVLSTGTLLLNDAYQRRILLFDPDLSRQTVVAGATAGVRPNMIYGSQRGVLLPFTADSSVFLDMDSHSFLVLDPSGQVARVMAPPPGNLRVLADVHRGRPVFTRDGSLVYQVDRSIKPGPRSSQPVIPDSAMIVRWRFGSDVDSVATVQIPQNRFIYNEFNTDARFRFKPLADDWVALPDGTIAILRGIDYHVDWISINGAKRSTPKMPMAWRKMSTAERQAVEDSLTELARKSLGSRGKLVLDAELPDYFPAFQPGQLKADFSGNLWVLPTTSEVTGRGLVYDVIDQQGKIIERVHFPEGRHLIAVRPDGAVYIAAKKSADSYVVEIGNVQR
jgi:hypothetical protein